MKKKHFIILSYPRLVTVHTCDRQRLAAHGWCIVDTNVGGSLQQHKCQQAAGCPQPQKLADVKVNELKDALADVCCLQVLLLLIKL